MMLQYLIIYLRKVKNMMNIISPLGDDMRDYLHDETKATGFAHSISFPESENDVSDTLRALYADRIPVTVQGNRTGLTAGAVPFGGHIMSMTRMTRVLGLRIDEDGAVYVRVQPGLSLGVFRQLLAQRAFDTSGWDKESRECLERLRRMPAQYFPPDPTETSASLGGMVSCNSSGAKTYRYGATRPYVSALRLVLADGDIIALRRGERFASGRRFELKTQSGRLISDELPGYTMPPCKNASGYYAADDMDLIDLFIGSDGTLGVITELELRLIEMPRVIWGINCFFRTEEQALDFVGYVRETGSSLAAVEFFDGRALDILRGYDDGVSVPDGFDSMIYVELHADSDESAREEIRAVGRAMQRAGGDERDTWCARSLPDRNRLLELRHRVPESVNALIAHRKASDPAIAKVGSDMAVPDGRFRELVEIYHRDLEKNGFEYAIWGHAGNNHLHVNVLPRSADDMRRGKAMFLEWARLVTAMGGTVSAEHGAGKNKANLLPVMYGEEGVREMAHLKSLFDPDCILGRGNMFPEEWMK